MSVRVYERYKREEAEKRERKGQVITMKDYFTTTSLIKLRSLPIEIYSQPPPSSPDSNLLSSSTLT